MRHLSIEMFGVLRGSDTGIRMAPTYDAYLTTKGKGGSGCPELEGIIWAVSLQEKPKILCI
jgi:hypothetical protein